MITPLDQRQMFQTLTLEALKASVEVNEQLQREAGHRQALAARMTEEQASVPQIPETGVLRAEDRHGRRQDQGGHGSGKEPDGQGDASGQGATANAAETHMDFLA